MGVVIARCARLTAEEEEERSQMKKDRGESGNDGQVKVVLQSAFGGWLFLLSPRVLFIREYIIYPSSLLLLFPFSSLMTSFSDQRFPHVKSFQFSHDLLGVN